MTANRIRGWRFLLPELQEAGLAPGPCTSITGGIEMIGGAQAIRQSMLLLLKTRPGERVMRPDYGCHLDRLFFAPNDDTTAGLAIHYVSSALARWEQRIDVLRVDAVRHPQLPEALSITVDFRVKVIREMSSLAIVLNLAEG